MDIITALSGSLRAGRKSTKKKQLELPSTFGEILFSERIGDCDS